MTPERANEMAAGLVEFYLGDRLARAGEPPGLRETTIELAAARFAGDTFDQTMRGQLGQLRGPSSTAVPDAYLADEEILEDAFQEAAAGLRVAAAVAGAILPATAFEQNLADKLADDPRIELRAEAARVLRPTTRPHHLAWSNNAAPWASGRRDEAAEWPPSSAQETAESTGRLRSVDSLARIDLGDYAGWVQIAMRERQATPATSYPQAPARQLSVTSSLVSSSGLDPSVELPASTTPWQVWTTPWPQWPVDLDRSRANAMLRDRDMRLTGLVLADARPSRGLGLAPVLLGPIGAVALALGLEPDPTAMGLRLSDSTGPALIGRVWRSSLVHDGHYTPLLPAVHGSDLLLRPDLFDRLIELVRPGRARVGTSIRWREGE